MMELLPYQRDGIAHCARRDATLLADEMGLGKTVQAVGLINAVQARKVLIVCPAALKINWHRELTKWLTEPREIAIVQGHAADWPEHADVVILNYNIASTYAGSMRGIEWDLIILDEAHNLSNAKAKQSIAILGCMGRSAGGIRARRKLALTGTPMRNRPCELYSLLHYLVPGEFGTRGEYEKRYCDAKFTTQFRAGKGKVRAWDVSGSSNEADLQNRLRAGVMLRRTKAEVLTQLPDKRRQVLDVDIGAHAVIAKERKLWAELLALSGSEKSAVAQLTAGTKLAEELAEVRLDLACRRAKHAIEHITGLLESEKKVVVFAYSRAVIQLLYEGLPAGTAVQVHGGSTMTARQAAVDDFQNDDRIKVFIGQIQAAGTGLTLTAASTVLFVERTWVPAEISQAEDRCHRIGQKRMVLVQHLVAQGTIDADQARRLVEKQETIDACIGTQSDPVKETGDEAVIELKPQPTENMTMGIEQKLDELILAMTALTTALNTRNCAAPTTTAPACDAGTVTPRPGSETEAPAAPAKAPRATKAKATPVEAPTPEPVAEVPVTPPYTPTKDELKRAAVDLINKLAVDKTPEGLASARATVRGMITAVHDKFTNVDALPESKYSAVWAAIQGDLNG